jgi:uncharacterized peroxidase-related enzyme
VSGDDELAIQVRRDYRNASLDPKTRALMDFAVQVTREPGTVTRRTIDDLREHGWTDEEILAATEVIGFFNYYARMADALGVEAEDFMERDPTVWPTE